MASQEYRDQIFQVIYAIPHGKVATYGQIATLAGLPGRARLVGRLLKELPRGTSLPWHRVVNSQGRISIAENSPAYQHQIDRLQDEGICYLHRRVSLRNFGWQP